MEVNAANAELKVRYAKILGTLNRDVFDLEEDEDLYSGVFLPIAFEEYSQVPVKVMLVGREPGSWRPTPDLLDPPRLQTVLEANPEGLKSLVTQCAERYELQYQKPDWWRGRGRKFCDYHDRIVNELPLHAGPDQMRRRKSIIWANLLAWSWNAGNPLSRPPWEVSEICRVSSALLAAQIELLKPKHIVFSTGRSVDHIISTLFEKHFHQRFWDGRGDLWQFAAAGAQCYRVAHYSARGHAVKRHEPHWGQVIELIKGIAGGGQGR